MQPYLKMVLRSLSTGTSKYIKSAAPLPIEWRYMMKLSIHNSGPLDVQVKPTAIPGCAVACLSHFACRLSKCINAAKIKTSCSIFFVPESDSCSQAGASTWEGQDALRLTTAGETSTECSQIASASTG